jgi:predicted outer membrane repeat protein
MKRAVISFSSAFFLFLTTGLYSQTIYVSGVINSNTEWEADTVKVVGDLTVTQGVLLTVNPGTYIEFQGHFEINIAGSFRAIGTPTDTIVFTSYDTTGFWADTLSVAGGWAGIKFQNSSTSPDSAVFEYCRIQYAKKYDDYGGDINGGAIMAEDYGLLHIKNCALNYCMVICYTNGINGPAGGAVFCRKVASVVIDSNSFTGNRSFDNGGAIHIDPDCQVLIANNMFIGNRAINFRILPPPWYLVIGGTGGAIGTTDDLGFSPTICNNYCFNNQTINGVIYTSNRHGRIFNNVICNNYGMGIMDGHQLSETRIFNNTITLHLVEFF